MIPYSTQTIENDDLEAVRDVLTSGFLTCGPVITEFEDRVASYVNAQFAVGVNSCTSALHLAMIALGIQNGDSSFGHIAGERAASASGQVADFMDYIHTVDDFAKYGVARQLRVVYQLGAGHVGVSFALVGEFGYRVAIGDGRGVEKSVVYHIDKKLGRSRVGVVGACHGNCACGVFQPRFKRLAPFVGNGGAGGFFGIFGIVATALHHKVGDYTVKNRALVMPAFNVLQKVVDGFWGSGRVKLHHKIALAGAEFDLRVGCSSGWACRRGRWCGRFASSGCQCAACQAECCQCGF